jgi:putative peptide zinc metalloprotease protein
LKLFGFDYGGSTFEVFGSGWSGLEWLVVDGVEVARKRNFSASSHYQYTSPRLGALALRFELQSLQGRVSYELQRDGEPVAAATLPLPRGAGQAAPEPAPAPAAAVGEPPREPARSKGHAVVWLGLATKIFQSGKALKVVLAGVAVSGWTVLYSLPFALALTATLVFHEWGHLRAMRRFGIPTKGMYLIPFVGGIAVGEQARTHWEDVYISMMGPVYGLAMTVACYLLYLATGSHLVGLVASVSALVNVFNLLPIHPLDGGRVVKALVFSGRSRWAFLAFLVASAAFFAVSTMLGLALLTFFIVIGALDLLVSWQQRAADPKPPLNRYGIWFSAAWYVLTIALFIGIIVLIARGGLPGSEIAVHLLKS